MSTATTVSISNKAQAGILFLAFALPALVAFASGAVTLASEAVLFGAFLAGFVAAVKELAGTSVSAKEQAVLMLAAFLIAPLASVLSTGSVSPYALVAAVIGGLIFASKETISGLTSKQQAFLVFLAFILGPIVPVLSGQTVTLLAVITALVGGLLAYMKEVLGITLPTSSTSNTPAPATVGTTTA